MTEEASERYAKRKVKERKWNPQGTGSGSMLVNQFKNAFSGSLFLYKSPKEEKKLFHITLLHLLLKQKLFQG